MKYIRTILALIFVLATVSSAFSEEGSEAVTDSAFSQEQYLIPEENPQINSGGLSFGVGLQLAYPMGDFRKNNNHTCIGVGGYIGALLKDSPCRVGFEFMTMFYGSLKSKMDYTFGDEDATTDYNFSNYDLFCRIQPQRGIIQPYVEGVIGFNYLSTTQKITDYYGEAEATETALYDFAFSYGLGGGAQIFLGKLLGSNSIINGDILLDADIRYIFGGKAEYFPAKGPVYRDGEWIYEKYTSRTDVVSVRMGVGFKF